MGRSAVIGVALDRPAPPGGVTVTLTSEVPATLNVPLGQTTALPVTIAPNAAPPGGVVITLTSSDPSRVELLTPSVTIPAGQFSANATVRGAGIGTATIRAVHPEYSEAAGQVTTRAALNILQPSVVLNASFPMNITIQLESAGQAIAAPPPGLTVTLTTADPGCLSVPSSVTIPAGLVNTAMALRHGGTASLPCNTSVTASAPNITQDSVAVRVDPVPGITFSISTFNRSTHPVGAGLQSSCPYGCSVRLGASNHGGVAVHLESSDATKILLSPNGTTPGAATLDLAVPNGQTVASFVVQGVETATPLPSTVTITASAPGFTNGTSTATVVQPAFDLGGLPATATSLSVNTDFSVQIGIPNTSNTGLDELQAVRAGGTTKTVTVTNSNSVVAQLVAASGTGNNVTAQIPPGQSSSPTSVATGGVAFDPLSAGSTTVSAGIPGFIPLSGAAKNVTVTP